MNKVVSSILLVLSVVLVIGFCCYGLYQIPEIKGWINDVVQQEQTPDVPADDNTGNDNTGNDNNNQNDEDSNSSNEIITNSAKLEKYISGELNQVYYEGTVEPYLTSLSNLQSIYYPNIQIHDQAITNNSLEYIRFDNIKEIYSPFLSFELSETKEVKIVLTSTETKCFFNASCFYPADLLVVKLYVYEGYLDWYKDRLSTSTNIEVLTLDDLENPVTFDTSEDKELQAFLARETSGTFASDTLTKISPYAFWGQHFDTIILSNVKNLEAFSFAECESLTSLVIPKVENFELDALYDCHSLKFLDLPACTTFTNDVQLDYLEEVVFYHFVDIDSSSISITFYVPDSLYEIYINEYSSVYPLSTFKKHSELEIS